MVAKKNVDRYFETGKIDIYYFNSLSNDAVAELVRLVDADDPEVAQKAAEILADRKERIYERTDWQSFNLADLRAKRAISGK